MLVLTIWMKSLIKSECGWQKTKALHSKYINKFRGAILYGVLLLITSLLHKFSTASVSKPDYCVYIPLTLHCLHFVLKQLILVHFQHGWFQSNFHPWAAFRYTVHILSGKPKGKSAITRFDVLMWSWILLSWLTLVSTPVWWNVHSQ